MSKDLYLSAHWEGHEDAHPVDDICHMLNKHAEEALASPFLSFWNRAIGEGAGKGLFAEWVERRPATPAEALTTAGTPKPALWRRRTKAVAV